MGATPRIIGSRARRIEDPALLRGAGQYVDDIHLDGMVHAAFLRSSHAHAFIGTIDAGAASNMPGVIAIHTAATIAPLLASLRLPIAFPAGQLPDHVMPYVLTPKEVLHVGEAVAMVIATSRHAAEDAADAIIVDYQVLPAVVDARTVLAATTPKSRIEIDANRYKSLRFEYGDCTTVFRQAAHVFDETLHSHRGMAHSMETRGIVASFEAMTQALTVWSSTQMSHELAHTLADMVMLAADRVRVIAPEVGGGFGAKYLVYPEEVAVAAVARALARPVKWIEDRREHFISAIQERDQFWTMQVAVDTDGHVLGVRGQMIHDQGAYAPHSYSVAYNAATTLMGAYMIPAYDLDVVLALTNKPPVIPVRGAGYPQSNFVIERLMDRIARELKLDRAEVRKRNLIPASAMPYETPLKNRAGVPIVYDSGDYLGTQEDALQRADYAGFAARQQAARAHGRYIGIGIAQGVKGSGRGPFESATVRVNVNGRVSVYTGALAMGQGIRTALAQICADELGVALDAIDVVAGDTGYIALGMGGYASRQAITAGTSTLLAARAVKAKAIKAAALMLEASDADLVISNGRVHVDGVAEHAIPIGRIAAQLRGMPGYSFPEGIEPGLESTQAWRVDALAYANAFHVCEVEVDIDTGSVQVLRYLAVQDCGKLINPLIAEGQIHGSIVHGIGNALFEEMHYDDAGQPTTTTFADYLLTTATDVPMLEVHWRETPSPLNPLGIKGVAEAGIVCVVAAVASAVENALEPFGVRITEAPLSPVRVLELIGS